LAVGFQFAVEQGFFFSGRQAAIEQVALFHVTNALENFAAVRQFELGQFQQNFSFAHGFNLGWQLRFGNAARRFCGCDC
jgi:hypothetical protein